MKKNILFGLIILSFVLAGCKQDVKEEKEASTEVTKELSGGQEEVTETPEHTEIPGQNTQSFKGRVIENQTFEIQLNDWGMVTFTSVAPEENSNDPEFLLVKNDKVIYEFPEIKADASDSFKQISGVKFSDVNMDGKKDVLLLLQYCNDGDSWNMPVIFLQENPDNMMYLDYPNLESYKVEAKTENGTPFYRDTFFEEFLGKQHLTEKLSDMEGVWTDYVEYLDSISVPLWTSKSRLRYLHKTGTSGQLTLILPMNNINSRWLIWIWTDKWNFWFHILAAQDFFLIQVFTM